MKTYYVRDRRTTSVVTVRAPDHFTVVEVLQFAYRHFHDGQSCPLNANLDDHVHLEKEPTELVIPNESTSVFRQLSPAKYLVRLSNGQRVLLCEGANALSIAEYDDHGTPTYLAQITMDGVLTYGNSADAGEHLVRGLRDPAKK